MSDTRPSFAFVLSPPTSSEFDVDEVTRNLYGIHFSLRALSSALNADPILIEHSEQVLDEAEEGFHEHDTVVHELGRRAASRFLNFAIDHLVMMVHDEDDQPAEITQTAIAILVAHLQAINDNVNRKGYTFRQRQTAAAHTKAALSVLGTMIGSLVPVARKQTAFADFETRRESGQGYIGEPGLDEALKRAFADVLGQR
jgi:hypothetical protein